MAESDGAEFYVYECENNDGMQTLVETYKYRPGYDERDCCSLIGILGWGGGWNE